jgi:hypothetical protein
MKNLFTLCIDDISKVFDDVFPEDATRVKYLYKEKKKKLFIDLIMPEKSNTSQFMQVTFIRHVQFS